jgi:putative FmdB family regulatory protein
LRLFQNQPSFETASLSISIKEVKMPTYEYECKSCGHTFEIFQSMKEDPLKNCPKCGKEIRRLINGGSGVIFKGPGFYVTDKKGGGKPAPASPAGAAPAKPDAAAKDSASACGGCPAAASGSCPSASGEVSKAV